MAGGAMAFRPLIDRGSDSLPRYGATPDVAGPRQSRPRHVRLVATAVAGVALVAAVMLVGLAVHSTPRTNELVSVGDDMDKRYFSAVAHGDEGDSFLKKLQNMWFVTSNKGLDGIAKDAE
eukprot:3335415-Rhodomonas_salina.1